jgi:aspartate aminotransferase
LVLNNPHNPTGIVYSKEELEKITEVCKKHNILVLADEIYALSTYDMSKFTSMGLVYPEGCFITNGLSKDRSAGGYRLGSCILPTNGWETLQKDFKKVAATVYTNVSTPTQYAAIKAYEPNDEIEDYINTTRQIHRIMGHYLSAEWNKVDGIKATRPDGAFYFFADFNELKPDLKKKGVATSNQLGESLLSCPHHLGTVTGDACMLDPDDYGARIAFVDYDGKKAFENYKQNPPKSSSDEIEFVKQNSPMMVKSVDALRGWVDFIKA